MHKFETSLDYTKEDFSIPQERLSIATLNVGDLVTLLRNWGVQIADEKIFKQIEFHTGKCFMRRNYEVHISEVPYAVEFPEKTKQRVVAYQFTTEGREIEINLTDYKKPKVVQEQRDSGSPIGLMQKQKYGLVGSIIAQGQERENLIREYCAAQDCINEFVEGHRVGDSGLISCAEEKEFLN